MTRRLCVLCVGLALALLLPAQPPKPFIPLTVDAYHQLIGAHRGHVVVVNFWATYCIPCRKEIPELVKMTAALKSRGLDFVLISADEKDQAAAALKFIASKGAAPLYIENPPDPEKYAAAIHPGWDGALPSTFVYDKSGKKVGTFLGEVNTKDLQTFLQKYL